MVKQVFSNFKTHFSYKDLSSHFQKVFCFQKIQALAYKTKFISRSTSRLNGLDFLKALVLSSFDNASLSGISDHLVKVNKKAKITSQGLRQRINTQKAEDFLYECAKNVLASKFNTLSQLDSLSHFTKVLIHDSTECELNEELEEHFKGSGGGCASSSSVKIDIIMELISFSIQQIHLTDRRQPDTKLNSEMIKHIVPGSIVIKDLGYFELDNFELIVKNKAFFYQDCTLLVRFLHMRMINKQPI